MPIDESLNKILKEMWRIDNKRMKKEVMEHSEISFFNSNLEIIKDYYRENHIHWKDQEKLND